jgi:hypothetical protein
VQAGAGSCFIYHVNGAVWQAAVWNVPLRRLGSCRRQGCAVQCSTSAPVTSRGQLVTRAQRNKGTILQSIPCTAAAAVHASEPPC